MDERLLLVEDDASIREIVSIGLIAAGFRLVTATDGRRLRAKVEDDPAHPALNRRKLRDQRGVIEVFESSA